MIEPKRPPRSPYEWLPYEAVVTFREFVREWIHETFREPTREEVQRWWDEGVPVEIALRDQITIDRHSSLCALNATGHRGPCTCGAEGGRDA